MHRVVVCHSLQYINLKANNLKMKSKGAVAMENKLEKIGQNNFMDNFVKTDDILKDMCGIIESSQKAAYRAVNTTLIQRNWLLGYRIASEELQGEDRAKYGAEIIKKLAKELSAEYGKGYTKSNLYSFYSFYKTYPEIFQTSSGKSVGLLSWSHYATLLQVKEKAARDWYEKEAATIGIVLCSDTDDDIARYSVMHGNEQLFASKYKLYLPTKEELKAEIETQKAMFYLQQQDNEDRNKNYTFNIE